MRRSAELSTNSGDAEVTSASVLAGTAAVSAGVEAGAGLADDGSAGADGGWVPRSASLPFALGGVLMSTAYGVGVAGG
ncbi:hypothetical protein GCM10027406_08300 [Leifsonia lichenia]